MEELVGKRITGVRSDKLHTTLRFDAADGPVTYTAQGDCCSESWFNHLTGLCFLLGATVNRVDAIPEKSAEGSRQECDVVYGWHLHTEKGTCAIEMRNSSNGYYGGWAELSASDDSSSDQVLDDF